MANPIKALGSVIQAGFELAAAKATAKLDAKREREAKNYTATADEQRILKFVEDGRRVRQTTLDAFEAIWSKAILYSAGVQHLRFIASMRQYEPKRVEDWVPLPVINLIQPKVQRIVDMFTRNRPTIYVEPKSQSEEDRMAADYGTKVAKDLWRRNEMSDKVDDCATWMTTTGNTFINTIIDTTLRNAMKIPRFTVGEDPIVGMDGMPVISPETGQPVTTKRWDMERDEDGQPVYDEKPQGDVGWVVVPTFAMTVPLASHSLHDSAWLMETQLYATHTLKELYPKMADYIPETGHVVSQDLYQYRITSLLTSGLHGVIRTLDPWAQEGYSICNKFERAPDRDFPNGILVVETDGIPLYIGDLPLGTRFSYEHCGYYRVPHRFWYRGPVEDMFSSQDQINKLEQFLQMNDAFNINPVVYVPEEAGIADGAIKNKPGTIVKYNYPYEPKRHEGTSMPPQVVQRRQLYFEDLDVLSGVRDVLEGNPPPGVTAGVAITRLGEEAEGLFSPVVKRWESFLERTMRSGLEMVQRYYEEPRHLAIQGDEGGIEEIQNFLGSMLRGNTNVIMEAGSSRPRSKAGQQQQLIDVIQMGLLPEVFADPGKRQRALEELGVTQLKPEEGLDWKRARWEDEMLSRSTGWDQIIRNAGDNDVVHLQVHTAYMKTQEWLRLPQMVQQRHLIHQIEHLDALEQQGGMAVTTGTEDIAPPAEATETQSTPGAPGEQGTSPQPEAQNVA